MLASLLAIPDRGAKTPGPGVSPRQRLSGKRGNLMCAITAALLANGTPKAQATLVKLVAGEIVAEDEQAAVEGALDGLAQRAGKETEGVVVQAILAPEQSRPSGRGLLTADGLRKAAIAAVRACGSPRLPLAPGRRGARSAAARRSQKDAAKPALRAGNGELGSAGGALRKRRDRRRHARNAGAISAGLRRAVCLPPAADSPRAAGAEPCGRPSGSAAEGPCGRTLFGYHGRRNPVALAPGSALHRRPGRCGQPPVGAAGVARFGAGPRGAGRHDAHRLGPLDALPNPAPQLAGRSPQHRAHPPCASDVLGAGLVGEHEAAAPPDRHHGLGKVLTSLGDPQETTPKREGEGLCRRQPG